MPVSSVRFLYSGLSVGLLALVATTGCNGPGKGDSAANNGDSGSDTQVNYDPGCITVDGAGGYAHIGDAITVASEGSAIALCAGTWAEVVTVDKGVTITGAGVDQTILQGDGQSPPITITGANATISGVTVQSTVTGMSVSGSGNTIDGVKFDATGDWSFQAAGATGLTVSNTEFNQPTNGALDVEGGDATITANTFDLPDSIAIQIGGGATATVTDNVINGVIMDKRNYKDGYGISVDSSTATISGNTITAAGGAAVRLKAGTLDISNETWDQGAYGFLSESGSATIDSSVLTGQTVSGIQASGDSYSVTNSTVSADATTACDNNYAAFNGGNYACGGVFIAADVGVTLTDDAVTGFNDFGVLIAPFTATSTVATLTNLTVDSTGRNGIYLSGASTTATNVSVTNLREPELATPCVDPSGGYVISDSPAMLINGGDITMTGGVFSGNQGWGMVVATGRAKVDATTFSDSACSSLLNFEGAVTLTNSAFTGYSALGSLWDYIGATTVTDSSFTGNDLTATDSYSYDDGSGHTITYEYTSISGVDISLNSSTDVITGSTFTGGVEAIYSYLADVEVSDSTFTTYAADILVASDNARTLFKGNSVDGLNGALVSVNGGSVELDDNTVGTTGGLTQSYSYYQDGVLEDGYPVTYTSYPPLAYADDGYDQSGNVVAGDLIINGLTADTLQSYLVSDYECGLEFSNIDIGTVGASQASGAVYGYWYSQDPLVVIDGLTIGNALGGGISLYSYTSGSSYIALSNLEFDAVTGTAVSASNLADVSISNASFPAPTGDGVSVTGRSAGDSTVEVDNVTVGGGDSNGMEFSTLASGTITNSSVTGRSVGVTLKNVAAADVESNVITGNSRFGMACTDATFTSCAANDLSGNTLGTQDGCSDDCGL